VCIIMCAWRRRGEFDPHLDRDASFCVHHHVRVLKFSLEASLLR
jgi:hypothetical protein